MPALCCCNPRNPLLTSNWVRQLETSPQDVHPLFNGTLCYRITPLCCTSAH